jgi:cell division protein FtsQ
MPFKLKVILILLSILLIVSYITFSIVSFSGKSDEKVCQNMIISIKDSTELRFITTPKVATILQKANMNPIGKTMKEINPALIEETLLKHPVIKEAQCYKTPSGNIKIDIRQKKPIFRIMLNNGNNYYVDNNKEKIPLSPDFVAYVPIVTGTATNEYITNELFNFIVFLQEDNFWNAQITQIDINNNKEIELSPRVGNHTILLGTLDNYDQKLENLLKLYKEALNTGGWNQYNKIDLRYKNQIICTKKP